MGGMMEKEDDEENKYLETNSRPNLICKNLGDGTIKRGKDLHCELWLDPAFVNQVIESIRKR